MSTVTGKIIYKLFEYVETAAAAVTAVLLISMLVCRISTVSGSSMDYTLGNGERILVWSFPYGMVSASDDGINTINRGDIVVFSHDNGEVIIKRVIAFEGETVFLDNENWKVYVSGEELSEPYVTRVTAPMSFEDTENTCIVPEGCIYVMGDNRYYSDDSRNSEIGPVSINRVVGKVIFRVFPVSRFGFVQ